MGATTTFAYYALEFLYFRLLSDPALRDKKNRFLLRIGKRTR